MLQYTPSALEMPHVIVWDIDGSDDEIRAELGDKFPNELQIEALSTRLA